MKASLWSQFVALLHKNLLIKARIKKQTIQEFFWPIYMFAILAAVKLGFPSGSQPEVPSYPENSLNRLAFFPASHLLVSPSNAEIGTVMADVISLLDWNATGQYSFDMYASAEEAEEAYKKNSEDGGAGIHFYDASLAKLNYSLRLPKVPKTDAGALYSGEGQCRNFPSGLDDYGCEANKYLYSGFVNLQLAIDTAWTRFDTGESSIPLPSLAVQLFPKAEYFPEIVTLQTLAAIYIIFAFSPIVGFLMTNLVTEKEKKIKEGMRMMGLKDSAFWASWGFTYLFVFVVLGCVCTLIAWLGKLYEQSNMFIVFLILLLYGTSIITLSFLFTPFFNRAKTAGGLAALLSIMLSMLYLPISLTREYGVDGPVSAIPAGAQFALCLLSPVALCLAIDTSLYIDVNRGGANWDNIDFGQFSIQDCLVMLAVDTVLYLLIAVYLDNVIPSEYGVRRPFYFFLSPSYWCPKEAGIGDHAHLIGAPQEEDDRVASHPLNDNFEPISSEMRGKEAIRIEDMHKQFKVKGKPMKAVNGFSLDIYEGQITCLLGHNGAGKTTLINILTGMTPPTSGAATIFGLDVTDTNQMSEIRQQTGVCPQHNILIECLSCEEHLRLFAKIKGVENKNLDKEIDQALDNVDLKDQKDVHAEKLSGGQKRKLSVAIALIGDPKVLFLDEPTAGMDPYSRRHLWALLKSRRQGRVVLLTTHFMDEADILSDRKAFISKGSLQCVGSSLFLKNRFGVGYHLGLVVDGNAETEPIEAVVKSHIPAAAITRSHGKELSFTLPLESVGCFAALFSTLEAQSGGVTKAASLGISSYGVSMTSLEEVFMKIGIIEQNDEDNEKEPNVVNSVAMSSSPTHAANIQRPSSPTNGGFAAAAPVTPAPATPASANDVHIRRTPSPINVAKNSVAPEQVINMPEGDADKLQTLQFWALFRVRFLLIRRTKSLFFMRVILPTIFLVIGLCIAKFVVPSQSADSALILEASMYSSFPADRSLPNLTYQLNPPISDNETAFVSAVSASGVGMTEVSAGDDLLAMAPHHMGQNIYSIEAVGQVITSNVTMLYNASATHSLPCMINMLTNSLRALVSLGRDITVSSFPWPNVDNPAAAVSTNAFSATILIGMAMLQMPNGYAVLMVYERQMKVRSQLRITGVGMKTYWASTAAADLIQLGGAMAFSFVVIMAFQIPMFMTAGAIICLLLLFICYIPIMLILAYVLSFAFNTIDTASAAIPNIFIFSALLPYVAVAMLDLIVGGSSPQALHIVFALLDPPYAIYGGLHYISRVYIVGTFKFGASASIPVSEYFRWDSNIIICLIAPIVHSVLLFFLLRVAEIRSTGGDSGDACRFGTNLQVAHGSAKENDDKPEDEDIDVKRERERVDNIAQDGMATNNSNEAQNVVVVRNLRKEFQTASKGCRKGFTGEPKVAVRNSAFSVQAGEVMGLLGPNGAGKTTTLNCIIAEEGLSAGTVCVGGHDVRSNLSEAFRCMGYCPQHDALWEDLTLKEHLIIYAAVKGIDKADADTVANQLIESLKVEEHADKIAKKLSGGTKRKLSYAVSMLGSPAVVLLDEPSTGMDPQSKRFLWDTISSAFPEGGDRGAVLTTHYMEEADALCNRVAIMVNGEMQCIGTTQHLKDRHGSGYILEVKLVSHNSEDLDAREQACQQAVTEFFPGSELVESFGERVTFRIATESIKALSEVFTWLEQGKETYGIEEYSFSQATLEQVFLEFAKKQEDTGAPGANIGPSSPSRLLSVPATNDPAPPSKSTYL